MSQRLTSCKNHNIFAELGKNHQHQQPKSIVLTCLCDKKNGKTPHFVELANGGWCSYF